MTEMTEHELDREATKKELYEIISKEKELNKIKYRVLRKLSDPARGNRMFATLNKLHEGILEYEGDLDDVVVDVLKEEDLIEFFKTGIHKPFYRSVDVFDEHKANEHQKRMVRGGYLMRNEFKRHKTPGHHISTVIKAKAMDNLQKQVDDLKERVSQQDTQLSYLLSGMGEVSDNVSVLNGVVLQDTDQSDIKIKLYRVKSDNPSVSFRALGKMFGISKNTATKWYEEMKSHLGVVSSGQ